MPSITSTETFRITHEVELDSLDDFPALRLVVTAYRDRVDTAVITGSMIDSENGEGYSAIVFEQHYSSRGDDALDLGDDEWASYFRQAAPVIEQMIVWYHEDCERLCKDVGRGVLSSESVAAKLLLARFCETWTAKAMAWMTTVEWTNEYPSHEDASCYANSANYLARRDSLTRAIANYRNTESASDVPERASLILAALRHS